MDNQFAETTSRYFQFHSDTVRGEKKARGLTEGWVAPLSMIDAVQGFGEEAWIDATPCTVLAFRLAGEPVTWLGRKNAGRTSEGASGVALQPRGTTNHSRALGNVRFAQIYLPDTLIDRVADSIRPGAKASGALRDDLVFLRNRDLDRHVMAYLAATTASPSKLEIEAAAILLVSHLLRAHHGYSDAPVARGGLAPWQLKRACDAMEAHLEHAIGLDMLAEIAGCSPAHFSRAFKLSTGLPPFVWLQQRRIERATELLADRHLSLAEIALSVGFSAQPQFTTAFRRTTSLTPGAWRRERLM